MKIGHVPCVLHVPGVVLWKEMWLDWHSSHHNLPSSANVISIIMIIGCHCGISRLTRTTGFATWILSGMQNVMEKWCMQWHVAFWETLHPCDLFLQVLFAICWCLVILEWCVSTDYWIKVVFLQNTFYLCPIYGFL